MAAAVAPAQKKLFFGLSVAGVSPRPSLLGCPYMSLPKKPLSDQPPSKKLATPPTSTNSPVRNSPAGPLGTFPKRTKAGPGQSRLDLAKGFVEEYMRSHASSDTTARPSLFGKLGKFLEKLIKRP